MRFKFWVLLSVLAIGCGDSAADTAGTELSEEDDSTLTGEDSTMMNDEDTGDDTGATQ